MLERMSLKVGNTFAQAVRLPVRQYPHSGRWHARFQKLEELVFGADLLERSIGTRPPAPQVGLPTAAGIHPRPAQRCTRQLANGPDEQQSGA